MKMQTARADLKERAKARAAAKQADYEKKVRDRDKRAGQSKGKDIGKDIQLPKDTPAAHEQVNLTDPESRLMRKSKREGYTQSYNSQAAVARTVRR